MIDTGNPYAMRLVVRRPVAPNRFNGTVIAEWNNVSNQWDQEVDWLQTHEHLIREGYVRVGVSAQRSAARITQPVATALTARVTAARRAGRTGAILHLTLLTAEAQRITDRPARVATALIGVLGTAHP